LLPFPPADQILAVLGQTDVLTQAGHEFGGVNYNLIAMRSNLAVKYLRAPCEVIIANKIRNRNKKYNIELFMRAVLAVWGWRNLRMSTTCFITAESLDERTTWRKIETCPERDGLLFKYAAQMDEAYKNLQFWQSCPVWLGLQPPRAFQVTNIHGYAKRQFALILEAAAPAMENHGPHQV